MTQFFSLSFSIFPLIMLKFKIFFFQLEYVLYPRSLARTTYSDKCQIGKNADEMAIEANGIVVVLYSFSGERKKKDKNEEK